MKLHLCVISNEQGATISQVWDETDLKLTFRRTVSQQLMLQWEELLQIVNSVVLNNEEDTIIWKFNSNGKHSVQPLYAVLSFRGVSPVLIPAVWKLNTPPKVHIFLWLLYNNKLLTRDNLQKRRDVADRSCLFCCEEEFVNHLFFDCCVAKLTWELISEIAGMKVGTNFESIGRWWISNDKNAVLNCTCAATLWSLWKSRNHLCFQEGTWQGEGQILGSIARWLKRWRLLLKQEKHVGLDHIVQRLLEEGSSPLKICWDSSTQHQVSSLARSPRVQSRPASTATPLIGPTTLDACAIAINV